MKSYKICLMMMLLIVMYAMAKETLYEMDGTNVGGTSKTKGPKALVHLYHGKNNPFTVSSDSRMYINSDERNFVNVGLQDSVIWLEVEKNTEYSICIEGSDEKGSWMVNDFSYERDGICVRLKSGNYVKNGMIKYVSHMGHVYTINLLVGMKYIDLSKNEHLLGYNNLKDVYFSSSFSEMHYIDSARFEKINEVLVVDKYKVTECEFVQTLWDSIPSNIHEDNYENFNFWIEKKRSMVKNGVCDSHDSAATRVYLYQALIYANNRSLRDGFKPVYSFEKTDNYGTTFKLYDDGSFNIGGSGFVHNSLDERKYIHVKIDKNADGYRLPYYDEWVALARGGRGYKNSHTIWGGGDSAKAVQYAWFGQIDLDDPYLKMNENDSFEKTWLEMSCGEWRQKSRPVGMLKPNDYGLYDMFGLVCESVLMPGKSLFSDEVYSCKGGFLTTSHKDLNFGNHCDNGRGYFYTTYQGLRLVREIK